MNRWILALATTLILPGAALPQTAKIQAETDKALHLARVYQDIEIMRRLVQRRVFSFAASCNKCHRDPYGDQLTFQVDRSASMDDIANYNEAANPDRGLGVLVGDYDGARRPARSSSSESVVIDGHYVKGHGVILQAQLPTSLLAFTREPRGHRAGGKKNPAPASEWDQIRKQLWGEKVDESAAPRDNPHEVTIQEVLLSVLAENGKHFQSLAANEQLIVNVTFRDAPAAATTLGDRGDRKPLGKWLSDSGGSASNPTGGNLPVQGGSTPNTAANISFKDYELLADFHIKQGRYQEAVKTLQKALEVNKDATRVSTLYRKLASAYMLQDAGQSNPAVLEKAAEFLKKAQEAGKTAAVPAQRLTLPTRVVITASRAALQQASPADLEEFRRHITVDWLRFDWPTLEYRPEPQKGEGPEK